jgi:hypothetical protein
LAAAYLRYKTGYLPSSELLNGAGDGLTAMDKYPPALEHGELASEISDYFSSIEDSFEISLEARHKRDLLDSAQGFFIFCSVFSAVPLLPLAAWGGAIWLLRNSTVAIKGWVVPIHSFFFWWILFAAFCIPIAIILSKADSRRSMRRSKDRLDLSLMRFALCYAIVLEIDRFSKNRLPKHIERAVGYWRRFQPMLGRMIEPFGNTRLFERYEQLSIAFD